jgi:hypothetical protein
MLMKQVVSSNIQAIGYDPDAKVLSVQFKIGGTYHYEGVPQEVYDGLDKAESVGKHFATVIKKAGYKFTKTI